MSTKQSQRIKFFIAFATFAIVSSMFIGYYSGTQEYYRNLPMGDVRVGEMGMITAVIYGFIVGVVSFTGLILYIFFVYIQNSRKTFKCKSCGFAVHSENDLFCRNCGARLTNHSLNSSA